MSKIIIKYVYNTVILVLSFLALFTIIAKYGLFYLWGGYKETTVLTLLELYQAI